MQDTTPFSRQFTVLWSDLDPNGHMRGARYLEYAAEMPFHFLAAHAFDLERFAREQVGPATLEQRIRHLREVRFGDCITVDFRLRGLTADASKWSFRHRIHRRDGTEVAIVEVEGIFFSLETRKSAVPPAGVEELIGSLPRDEDFSALDSR